MHSLTYTRSTTLRLLSPANCTVTSLHQQLSLVCRIQSGYSSSSLWISCPPVKLVQRTRCKYFNALYRGFTAGFHHQSVRCPYLFERNSSVSTLHSVLASHAPCATWSLLLCGACMSSRSLVGVLLAVAGGRSVNAFALGCGLRPAVGCGVFAGAPVVRRRFKLDAFRISDCSSWGKQRKSCGALSSLLA